ncbi:hypothetical protein DXG01_017245 [Tephrocybe rancida]|nr:hypothetical protein DXG01_017245 [Tephrocybe rancida]
MKCVMDAPPGRSHWIRWRYDIEHITDDDHPTFRQKRGPETPKKALPCKRNMIRIPARSAVPAPTEPPSASPPGSPSAPVTFTPAPPSQQDLEEVVVPKSSEANCIIYKNSKVKVAFCHLTPSLVKSELDTIDLTGETSDNNNLEGAPSSGRVDWPLKFVYSMSVGFDAMDTMSSDSRSVEERFRIAFNWDEETWPKTMFYAHQKTWKLATQEEKNQYIKAGLANAGLWTKFRHKVNTRFGGLAKLPHLGKGGKVKEKLLKGKKKQEQPHAKKVQVTIKEELKELHIEPQVMVKAEKQDIQVDVHHNVIYINDSDDE